MSEQQLRDQLEALRQTLDDREIQLSIEERSALESLANNLEARLLVREANDESVADPSLVDGVHLMIEELEVRYPSTATMVRNIMQTLSNMGI
ncbi:DUF4404 family protein [Halopseudomonas pertucinogena]|nr:DUF4404 family protein [Halopseudomonas pertucinogena]